MASMPSREEVAERARGIVERYYQEKREKLEKTFQDYLNEIKETFTAIARGFSDRLRG